ncbi:uncharacterized protein AMSG_09601 [Thecamonas trahens ATCC 50062]|uniref:EGF-like domain-containing protein n=1 Tax=Thecamonas trahens ATCC 50062 TaxID=461836 RepID=A0A0L0DNW0_THETB|nr:hypothetical protein AMSG_09601 [Thecamonas trahens ATCC 50062]KNC53955.1 hypothetical protein AMSG_09601 [Thecamonas trahens ATCC 50062]|eukprot:XP_013754157.1 hypothetical protein AMSG_09601 [Thecamonas trahens ATCC 50062]
MCEVSSGKCTCSAGWAGPDCRREACAGDSQCSGHGSCLGPEYVCECDAGYTGPNCATSILSDSQTVPWREHPSGGLPAWEPSVLARTQAVAVAVSESYMLVFGGGSIYGRSYRSDAVVFEPHLAGTGTEVTVPVSGQVPAPRSGAAGAYHSGSQTLYVFGGETAENVYTAEVYALSLNGTVPAVSGTWRKISAPGEPGLLAGTGAAAAYHSDGLIYVFGGYAADTGFSHRLAIFDPIVDAWVSYVSGPDDPWPRARQGGSLVSLPGTASLALFGGSAPNRIDLQDLWLLHGPTRTWSQITPGQSDPWPAARYLHSAVALSSDVMLVVGGRITTSPSPSLPPACFGDDAWAFVFSADKWVFLGSDMVRAPTPDAPWPGARYGHSTAVVPSVGVVLVGGFETGVMARTAWTWDIVDVLPPSVEAAYSGGRSACDELSSSCYDCGRHPSCVWCPFAEQCRPLRDEPGACDGEAGMPNGCLDQGCAALSSSGCSDCARRADCEYCTATSSCMASGSCSGTPVSSPAMCPETRDCTRAVECNACMDVDGCSWCHLGGGGNCFDESVPNACPTSSPLPAGVCRTRCEALSGCGQCTGALCMYCESTDDCFSSTDYLMAYPYAECPDWHFGLGDCPAPCSAHSTCGSCTDALDCGWCSSTATCVAGDTNGPHGASNAMADGTAAEPASCAADNWYFWECPCSESSLGCDACVSDLRCAYCVDAGQCLEGAFVGPPGNRSLTLPLEAECETYDVGFCPVCGAWTSCEECGADPACGWCGASQICERGGAVAPATCSSGWLYGVACPNCTAAASCGACVDVAGCGWCEGVGCVPGDGSIGAYENGLTCLAFDVYNCAGHCSVLGRGSCSSCVALDDPECGWCCTTASCTVSEACNGAPVREFYTETCPVCTASDCDECLAGFSGGSSACCGWCDETSSCIRVEPACSLWAFGSSCPADCTAESGCDECTAHSHCMWCATSERCRYSFDLGECPAQDWHSSSCPVRCADASSCRSCTGLAECGWCGAEDKCMRGTPSGPTTVVGTCLAEQWSFANCDAVCASRIVEVGRDEACQQCTAEPSCGYCPFMTSDTGIGACVTGATTGPVGSPCGSYVASGCPVVTQMTPGTSRNGVLESGQRRQLSLWTTAGDQTVTIKVTSSPPVAMFVSTKHFMPSSEAGFEWHVISPGSLVVTPAEFTDDVMPVGAFYVTLQCSGGLSACRYHVTASLSSPDKPPSNSAFWIVYFVGVFFGALIAVILIAVLVKKLRESLEAPSTAAFQRRAAINRRVRPHVPLRVIVPGNEHVASPWFLVLPVGESEPSVHAVLALPRGAFRIGQVVKTAPGKKMVRVSNRRAVDSANSHEPGAELRELPPHLRSMLHSSGESTMASSSVVSASRVTVSGVDHPLPSNSSGGELFAGVVPMADLVDTGSTSTSGSGFSGGGQDDADGSSDVWGVRVVADDTPLPTAGGVFEDDIGRELASDTWGELSSV